ncbi:MAG TPA: PilZ domain-containing protein [Bradyrhizobium sp.]
MQDRRQSVRDKVFLGGVAEINERGSTMDCVVRNINPRGACVEVDETSTFPENLSLSIPRRGRSFLARMIWRHANRVGVAFRTMVTDPQANDLDARLRRSQIKQRQLKRRIRELIGEG